MGSDRVAPPAPDSSKFPNCSVGGCWQVVRFAVAEFLGLAILTFVCTAYSKGSLGGPFAGGLVLCVAIWLFGPVSGGHINPAVTLYFTLTRRLSLVHTIVYWISQTLGALIGCLLAKGLAYKPGKAPETAGMTMVDDDFKFYQAFGLEVWGTALLVLVVAQSVDELRGKPKLWSIALGVGFVVVTQALCFGHISGCSLNPARSLGPAIANFNFKGQWIYILAPLLGSLIATILQEFILCQDASLARAKRLCTSWQFDRNVFYGNRGNDGSFTRRSPNHGSSSKGEGKQAFLDDTPESP